VSIGVAYLSLVKVF